MRDDVASPMRDDAAAEEEATTASFGASGSPAEVHTDFSSPSPSSSGSNYESAEEFHTPTDDSSAEEAEANEASFATTEANEEFASPTASDVKKEGIFCRIFSPFPSKKPRNDAQQKKEEEDSKQPATENASDSSINMDEEIIVGEGFEDDGFRKNKDVAASARLPTPTASPTASPSGEDDKFARYLQDQEDAKVISFVSLQHIDDDDKSKDDDEYAGNYNHMAGQISALSANVKEEPEDDDLKTEEGKLFVCGKCGGSMRGDQGYCRNLSPETSNECMGARARIGQSQGWGGTQVQAGHGFSQGFFRCHVCGVDNEEDAEICAACENKRPSTGQSTFGGAATTNSKTTLVVSSGTNATANMGGFTFGGPPASANGTTTAAGGGTNAPTNLGGFGAANAPTSMAGFSLDATTNMGGFMLGATNNMGGFGGTNAATNISGFTFGVTPTTTAGDSVPIPAAPANPFGDWAGFTTAPAPAVGAGEMLPFGAPAGRFSFGDSDDNVANAGEEEEVEVDNCGVTAPSEDNEGASNDEDLANTGGEEIEASAFKNDNEEATNDEEGHVRLVDVVGDLIQGKVTRGRRARICKKMAEECDQCTDDELCETHQAELFRSQN